MNIYLKELNYFKLTKKLNNIKNQEEYFTKINQVEKDV